MFRFKAETEDGVGWLVASFQWKSSDASDGDGLFQYAPGSGSLGWGCRDWPVISKDAYAVGLEQI